jgi:hypothetical protein
MENLKFYINNIEELNEYEKEYNKISFRKLVNKLFTDMILCNDITKIFYADISGKYIEPEIEVGADYDEENDEYLDIYQYFIVDFSSYTYSLFKKYKEQLGKEFVLYYINELDIYVLGVTHFGTGWDYVLTDIEPTTNLDEANL